MRLSPPPRERPNPERGKEDNSCKKQNDRRIRAEARRRRSDEVACNRLSFFSPVLPIFLSDLCVGFQQDLLFSLGRRSSGRNLLISCNAQLKEIMKTSVSNVRRIMNERCSPADQWLVVLLFVLCFREIISDRDFLLWDINLEKVTFSLRVLCVSDAIFSRANINDFLHLFSSFQKRTNNILTKSASLFRCAQTSHICCRRINGFSTHSVWLWAFGSFSYFPRLNVSRQKC